MNIQCHQNEEERQHKLEAYQDIAQRLPLHTHRVRTLQHNRGGLGRGIERRGDTGDHGREKCNAQHQDLDVQKLEQKTVDIGQGL